MTAREMQRRSAKTRWSGKTAEARRREMSEVARQRWREIDCPKWDGKHFGRDTAKIDGVVQCLPTVRCHTPGCGWRGEWSAKIIRKPKRAARLPNELSRCPK